MSMAEVSQTAKDFDRFCDNMGGDPTSADTLRDIADRIHAAEQRGREESEKHRNDLYDRGCDTIVQMTLLAKGLDGKRLRYNDLVAA